MTPNALQDMAEKMLQIYVKAESELSTAIAHRLYDGDFTGPWSRKKLKELRLMKKELSVIVKQLKTDAQEQLTECITSAYDMGNLGFVKDLQGRGFLPKLIEGRARADQIALILGDVEQKLAIADFNILRDSEDAYRRIIQESVAQAKTGAVTMQKATQISLNRFADRGVASFIDKAGRHWEMGTYAEMATLTGMTNAAVQGYAAGMKAHGEDLAMISQHEDACPMCVPWEGKVVSLSGETPGYPSMQEAIAAGLFHPRCLHNIGAYYEGMTTITGSVRPERDSTWGYQGRENQRYIERAIRRWKRRYDVAEDQDNRITAYNKIHEWEIQAQLNADEYEIPRKKSREGGPIDLDKMNGR